MGTPKAALQLEGSTLVEHIAGAIRVCASAIYVVAKPDDDVSAYGLPVIRDHSVEPALVHGIRAVLSAPGPVWRWIVACDMPSVNADLLRCLWMAAQRQAAPGACARLPGRIDCEPLPSLWHRDTAAHIVPQWGWSARAWLRAAGLAVWDVPTDAVAAFANVNTPADWDAYRQNHGGAE
jgi:molybdopterin-guanine dinucleotide biosynthesis protein A